MANLYVSPSGSATAPYDTWAKAATDLATAVTAAAASDTIWVHQATYVLTADATYDPAAKVRIIASNDTANAPPQTLGSATIDGSATAGVDFIIRGDDTYWRGITFISGGGATNSNFTLVDDASTLTFESCVFTMSSTGNTCFFRIGRGTSGAKSRLVTRGCTWSWGNIAQGFLMNTVYWESYGDNMDAGSVHPTVLFVSNNSEYSAWIDGADMSLISGTVFSGTIAQSLGMYFVGCDLHASVTRFSGTLDIGEGELWFLGCHSGDEHWHMEHYDCYGSTVAQNSIVVASTGATYDGTNRHAWLITTTANASPAHPYCSPWIDLNHDATASITPYVDVCRSGSSTAYTNAQIWAEFRVKNTSGSVRPTFVNDRASPVATPANQTTSSIGAGAWTGESGTSWFGKLDSGSAVTPAEIGQLSVRICVAVASVTDLYVDPQIKGI